MSLFGQLAAYLDNADPRAAACNMIAMIVAWNQPFYPLYLLWFVGGNAWLGCITFLSTPFFVAVPWMARRSSFAGRAMLPLVGLGNTALSSWAFGGRSGVGWFAIPCALIAALAFRRPERRTAIALILLAMVTPVAMHMLALASLGRYDAASYGRFFRMNAYSVVMLCAVIAWNFRKTFGAGDQVSTRVAR